MLHAGSARRAACTARATWAGCAAADHTTSPGAAGFTLRTRCWPSAGKGSQWPSMKSAGARPLANAAACAPAACAPAACPPAPGAGCMSGTCSCGGSTSASGRMACAQRRDANGHARTGAQDAQHGCWQRHGAIGFTAVGRTHSAESQAGVCSAADKPSEREVAAAAGAQRQLLGGAHQRDVVAARFQVRAAVERIAAVQIHKALLLASACMWAGCAVVDQDHLLAQCSRTRCCPSAGKGSYWPSRSSGQATGQRGAHRSSFCARGWLHIRRLLRLWRRDQHRQVAPVLEASRPRPRPRALSTTSTA